MIFVKLLRYYFVKMKLIINTDGGARGNPGPAGIGVVIRDESGKIVAKYKKYIGKATNNAAEYQALILALQAASKLGAIVLLIKMDSELIVRQMQGQYKIKEPALKKLAQEVLRLTNRFRQVTFCHIAREENKGADKLVNQAIDEHN